MGTNWTILIVTVLFTCAAACGSESGTGSDVAAESAAAPAADTRGRDEETSGAEEAFAMRVMDVFAITGRGIVVTGIVKSGAISVGETVCIGDGEPVRIEGIEMFRKVLERVAAGDNAGLLFANLSRADVSKGDEIRRCG